jgi:signal transduction histidine kinase
MPEQNVPSNDISALLAGNIHEVKNLLGQLFLALDEASLKARSDCPELAQRLADMRLTGRRVHDRLLHILNVYKADSGFFSANPDAYDPAEIIEDLVLEAQSLAGERLHVAGLSLAVNSWDMDRYLVESALTNALHNALRYAARRIQLSAREEDGYLVLQIEDDGPGFPATVLEQGAAPLPNGAGGSTGLGLYFSRTAAAAHQRQGRQGLVKIENGGALGGAVFALWLP